MQSMTLGLFIEGLTGAGEGGEPPEEDDLKTFAEALAAADAGNVAMFQKHMQISHADILTAPTTPVEILPAYSEDAVVAILTALVTSTIVTPYSNGETMVRVLLMWDNWSYEAAVPFYAPSSPGLWNMLDQDGYNAVTTGPLYVTGGNYVQGGQNNATKSGIQGKNLALNIDNGAGGDLTGGNAGNSLLLTVVGIARPV